MLRQFFFVSLLLFFISPAMAQDSPSDEDLAKIKKWSTQAVIAYDKGDYQTAFQLYKKAHQLLQHPKLSFGMAKCLERMGRYKEALQIAKQGLKENPSPRIRSRLKVKIAFLKKKLAKGYLTLLITPSGTNVKIDGKLKGQAPLETLEIEAGQHTLELSHPHYAKILQNIFIIGGQKLKLTFTLKAQTGTLSISTQPVHADVEIDGKPWGKTPLSHLQLPTGSHFITLHLPGYTPIKKQISISPQKDTVLSIILEKESTATIAKPWYTNWVAWSLLVLGAGTGIIGGVLWAQASQTHRDVENSVAHPELNNYSQKYLDNQWNHANTQEKVSGTLLGLSGGAILSGIILFASQPSSTITTKTKLTSHASFAHSKRGVTFYAIH